MREPSYGFQICYDWSRHSCYSFTVDLIINYCQQTWEGHYFIHWTSKSLTEALWYLLWNCQSYVTEFQFYTRLFNDTRLLSSARKYGRSVWWGVWATEIVWFAKWECWSQYPHHFVRTVGRCPRKITEIAAAPCSVSTGPRKHTAENRREELTLDRRVRNEYQEADQETIATSYEAYVRHWNLLYIWLVRLSVKSKWVHAVSSFTPTPVPVSTKSILNWSKVELTANMAV